MRRRLLITLTAVLVAVVASAWGYTGYQVFWRYSICYDIQGDPDLLRECAGYTRHIAGATEVSGIISGAAVVVLLAVLAWYALSKRRASVVSRH